MSRPNLLDAFFEWPIRTEGVWSLPQRAMSRVSEAFRPFPLVIQKDDKAMYIEVEVPGLREEDISMTFDKGLLDLSFRRAELSSSRETLLQERSTQAQEVRRRFQIGQDINVEQIQAHLAHGMLSITLPYKAKPEPQKISIKTIKPSVEA